MTENKKNNFDVKKILMNKAISYLAQYSTTSKKLTLNLETFAFKKKFDLPVLTIEKEINDVVYKCKNLGYLDDETFAKNKLNKMLANGISLKQASSKLLQFGIELDMAQSLIHKISSNDKNIELKSALKFAEKKRIGPFFKNSIAKGSKNDFNKFMGIFARAGFSYELSKQVFNLEGGFEAEQLISKLK